MLSPQRVLFKAGDNVLFWPQMNPVPEHPVPQLSFSTLLNTIPALYLPP